ncbi:hypothetical protein [Nocardia brasiliensis]|uniref:hypothetical protein n=1 Tax=Nocardia brasiliensis TaxID=37326 RepID=UPI003D8FD516
MPAPRKRIDRTKVAEPIADICDAVIELLERCSLTNKEALARAGDPVSQQTLSAQLLGQRGGPPPPEVVRALVVVVADELKVTPDSLYREYPMLERHVSPDPGPVELAGDPSSPEFAPSAEILAKAEWLWNLIIEGDERLAAIALHGLPLEAGYPHAVLVAVICQRDPGAAAALMRAIEEIFGTERARSVLAGLPARELRAVNEFDVSGYRTPPPLWNMNSRNRPEPAEVAEGIGRRLRGLINRGDNAQALQELTTLTEHDSRALLHVVHALLDAASPNPFQFTRPVMPVLNAMVHSPAVAAVGGAPSDQSEALYTVVEALLVDGRASGTHSYSRRVIEALEPAAFTAMLCRFAARSAFLTFAVSAARANLTDFIAAATDRQISAALPHLEEGHDAPHLARSLLHTGNDRLLVIAQADPAPVAKLICDAWDQEFHRLPDDKRTRALFEKLARVVQGASYDLLVLLAETWPAEATLWVATLWKATDVARNQPGAARGIARPLAILVAHVPESDRIPLAEHVFLDVDEDDTRETQIRVWIELIANAPDIAEPLVALVPVHSFMLTLRARARIEQHAWFPLWNEAMEALTDGDFVTAAARLGRLPDNYSLAHLKTMRPAEPDLPRWRKILRRLADSVRD